MSRAEVARLRALAHVLATSPGLGAFAVAVGHLGLDGALGLCETRDPPPRVQHVWDGLGYTLAQLPTAEEIRLVVIGAEIKRRVAIRRTNSEPIIPLHRLIEGLCSLEDAKKGKRLLRFYGGKVELRPEYGAL